MNAAATAAGWNPEIGGLILFGACCAALRTAIIGAGVIHRAVRRSHRALPGVLGGEQP